MWPQTEIQDLPQSERLSLKEVTRSDNDQSFQGHCLKQYSGQNIIIKSLSIRRLLMEESASFGG